MAVAAVTILTAGAGAAPATAAAGTATAGGTAAAGAGAGAAAAAGTAATAGAATSGITMAGIATTAATAAGTTALTTATISATQASMNADGDFFKQAKTIGKTTWDNTTSKESIENMAIAAAVAGAASWAMSATGGKPNLEAGTRVDSKVGINTVKTEDGIFKEVVGNPGVADKYQPVDMEAYNSLGGFGSPYDNNPIFKTINTFPSAPSGAAGHDVFMDRLILNGTLDPKAASTSIFVGASAPTYLIINACAAAPSLCGIYVNTMTDKDFLQTSNSKQQP